MGFGVFSGLVAVEWALDLVLEREFDVLGVFGGGVVQEGGLCSEDRVDKVIFTE